MLPSLPQNDPRPEERASQLAQTRSELRYAWDRPERIAMASELPRRLGYPTGVVAQVGAAGALLASNRAAVRLAGGPGAERGASTLAWCGGIFATVKVPSTAPQPGGTASDRAFAWQRVAGVNPMALARVARLPEAFPVSEALFEASMPGDSLAAAGAEGRLYLLDFERLDGLSGGAWPDGAAKHLCAPFALFVRPSGASELLPVAIQCARRPGPQAPIFGPRDGAAWQMARLAVQVADANLQESFFHLGRAHFLIEAFALAAERQLSSRHPLRALLDPHFEGTLAINDGARRELVAPGGQLDELMAPTLEGSLDLVRAALSSFRLDEALPPRDFARRGVDDPQLNYPYRDDGLLLWEAIERFARDHVAIAYPSAADLAADAELRAFVDELRSPEGGRLAGLPAAVTEAGALAELVAFVIYTTSALHAALNYSQYDFMGYAPNMPTAAGAPPPTGAVLDAEAAWTSALPRRAEVLAQLEFMHRQSQVRHNRLGHYPPGHFADPRAAAPLARLQGRLGEIDAIIAEREQKRLLPYPYLAPRNLTASIHIL